ncbi:hypothetical protein [Tabrizicola sp.]|uniref:hypothetical protein n=1 Tax=Tabrizicola sp. TaxID=2005166 RepID=UPI003F3C77EF
MTIPLSFAPLARIEQDIAALLPWNYLPAALPAIAGLRKIAGQADAAGLPETQGRYVFTFAPRSEPRSERRDSVSIFFASNAVLSDPVELVSLLNPNKPDSTKPYSTQTESAQRDSAQRESGLTASAEPATSERLFLGPPTNLAQEGMLPSTLEFKPGSDIDLDRIKRIAVIIDAGIAFWDPAFRDGGQSRFREMVYLDFDGPTIGKDVAERLSKKDIEDRCLLADTEGQHAVLAKLGNDFPNSFFGANGGAHTDAGWHGTGVADLLAGGEYPDGDDFALYGIELPMAVLRDHDGDSLSAVLTLTVEVILGITEAKGLSNLPMVIVLPFGFVAGPQDGTHPVAQAMAELLNRRQQISFVVPTGNHLQDRCAALIDPVEAPGPVTWRLPPDDFSPNSVDIVLKGTKPGPRTLGLALPGQAPVFVPLEINRPMAILYGTDIIGAVTRRPDTTTSAMIRLALLGTGVNNDGRPPAPAGDWEIWVGAGERAELCCLRDDRDPVADEAHPHRGAVFVDLQYRDADFTGAPLQDDVGDGNVRRLGTISVLATTPGAVPVGALERFGLGPEQPAVYSGRPRNGALPPQAELVDDGWQMRGRECAAKGTPQRTRMSGTSAAAGLHGRKLLGIPPRPLDQIDPGP